MNYSGRHYYYVGPAETAGLPMSPAAVVVDGPAELAAWLAAQGPDDGDEPFTFVVALDGRLRLAPRRSEHAALAGGEAVLAAGEMTFARADAGRRVTAVSNQSTGYCPDVDSWPPVGAALDRLEVGHPGGYTEEIVFRRCPSCGERNIVRDDNFVCALCDGDLPASWNFEQHLLGWWNPGWYNLDQSLAVGRPDTFAFSRAAQPPPGYDVLLAGDVGTPGHDWDYWSATVESIRHHHFGAVAEVDARPFGQYTFTFGDGRWVTIEAEEGPGHVNAASPGFPVGDCDPAWAGNAGWGLTVVLSEVVRAPAPD